MKSLNRYIYIVKKRRSGRDSNQGPSTVQARTSSCNNFSNDHEPSQKIRQTLHKEQTAYIEYLNSNPMFTNAFSNWCCLYSIEQDLSKN